jgi:hypothetical protein
VYFDFYALPIGDGARVEQHRGTLFDPIGRVRFQPDYIGVTLFDVDTFGACSPVLVNQHFPPCALANQRSTGDKQHVLAPRSDLKQQLRSEFAKILAEYFHGAALNHCESSLALVVSNPFMGELLAHLDSPVQKIIDAKHVLDLTSLNAKDLDKRLRTEFRL